MTGVMPVAGSPAKSSAMIPGRAAQERVRRGDHPADPDRDQPRAPARSCEADDPVHRVGPARRRRPLAPGRARHPLAQRATELVPLGARGRPLPQRGEPAVDPAVEQAAHAPEPTAAPPPRTAGPAGSHPAGPATGPADAVAPPPDRTPSADPAPTGPAWCCRRWARRSGGADDLLERPGVAVGIGEVDEPAPGLVVDLAHLDPCGRPAPCGRRRRRRRPSARRAASPAACR